MQALFTLYLFISNTFTSPAVEKVTFYSTDSIKITADLYLNNYDLPFILLFHSSEGSRGEFADIASRLNKLGYNCLAVDLRIGNKSNYIANETAERIKNKGNQSSFIDCRKDIEASIHYVEKFNDEPVILFGNSFSASLCLMVAKNSSNIQAVIAFSPGEFFRPEVSVKDKIKDLSIPVFVSSTNLEMEYIKDLLSGIPSENKTIFSPKTGMGLHGIKMLNNDYEFSNDCWFDLLLFFKKLKNN